MKLTLTLVLVTMAACASILCGTSAEPLPQPEAPPAEIRSRFAALDDVRLLATGLLQLGQSLREFVHKTKAQINDIFQKLQNFDFYFNQLSNMATEIKEEEEELKKTTVVLKANNDQLKNQSLEISSKVDYILQERQQLQSAVGGLEQRVRSLSLDMVSSRQLEEITVLRELSQTQEQSIVDLLKAVKEQSEQLNYQRMKINILEEKLATNTLVQETVETMTDISVSETPTLTPFLSTNGSQTNVSLPSDCSDLFDRGERVSGVYAIRPEGHLAFMAYCDMTQDGGSTVIQRRKDGSVNFDQTWEGYENGFGEFHGEFWLGLKKIYSLASNGDRLLHIQLEDWKQGSRSIEYSFSLEGPDSSYTIHLAQVSGDLPDAMINHTGMMFSTKDRDNDNHQDSNCALDYTGGWWFNACGDTNLNGRYTHFRPKGRLERRRGIQWRPSRRTAYSLRHTQMSIGPASARRPAVSTTPPSTELNFI